MADSTLLPTIIAQRSAYKGLTAQQAKELLKQYGYNALPAGKEDGTLKHLFHILTEPMLLLILATAVIYFFLGKRTETIIFLLAVIPIALMELVQEHRTGKAIKALDALTVTKCQVYRDGRITTLETKFLVPGDLVHLTAGDRVPADGFLLLSPGMMVDESVLTGEAFSVAKSAAPEKIEEIKDQHKLSQGTLVNQGEGLLLVAATGVNTSYGHLGTLLEKIEKERTPLQKKIDRLVRWVAVFAFASLIVLTILLGLNKGWLEGLLGGLTVAMALIPEEIPVVFSVFLILGVLRMAKRNAVVREMALVETLGSVTVICTDKTGTLTEGRMSLEKVYFQGKLTAVDEKYKDHYNEFTQAALLALERVPVDPIEIEMHRFAKTIGIDTHAFFADYELVEDRAFDAQTRMVHHLWKDKNDGYCQYSAGAPEFIISASTLGGGAKKQALDMYEQMSEQGYRVVGIARRCCERSEQINDSNLEFLGLLVMSDPPRREVPNAVDVCQKAGIRIIMITGDNKLTAHAIAEKIGLIHDEEILSGDDIEKASPEALKELVKRHSIFARVKPEQKYALVETLKSMVEVVAMTGDGVNDAPALKKSNIGVAMGIKGTEVARAAAGMVLLDDNFSTIVQAVKEGRRIYENIRSAFVFLISFHIPIMALAVVPLFFGQSLVFFPIHIIFLEFICDPASVLGFEKEPPRRTLMKEKPRRANEPILTRSLWLVTLLQGVSIFAVSFAFYYYYAIRGGNIELGRAACFIALIFAQISLLLFTREWAQVKSNKVILAISAATLALITFIAFAPFLRTFFAFAPMSVPFFATTAAVGVGTMVLASAFIVWYRRRYV